MDVNACNFDPEALVPNLALCTYPAANSWTAMATARTTPTAMGCVTSSRFWLYRSRAQNYNPQATDDNGTCQAAQVGGCILPFACNYNPEANFYIQEAVNSRLAEVWRHLTTAPILTRATLDKRGHANS